jgi:hypothetical protein
MCTGSIEYYIDKVETWWWADPDGCVQALMTAELASAFPENAGRADAKDVSLKVPTADVRCL